MSTFVSNQRDRRTALQLDTSSVNAELLRASIIAETSPITMLKTGWLPGNIVSYLDVDEGSQDDFTFRLPRNPPPPRPTSRPLLQLQTQPQYAPPPRHRKLALPMICLSPVFEMAEDKSPSPLTAISSPLSLRRIASTDMGGSLELDTALSFYFSRTSLQDVTEEDGEDEVAATVKALRRMSDISLSDFPLPPFPPMNSSRLIEAFESPASPSPHDSFQFTPTPSLTSSSRFSDSENGEDVDDAASDTSRYSLDQVQTTVVHSPERRSVFEPLNEEDWHHTVDTTGYVIALHQYPSSRQPSSRSYSWDQSEREERHFVSDGC
ncbi:hypothetical protein DL93DRAFT_2084904 [Clavulina sp. PMI_390]|nr:hypothetical protein DL93DRAFT_2084904 [Clavulina sp. PMI_390]